MIINQKSKLAAWWMVGGLLMLIFAYNPLFLQAALYPKLLALQLLSFGVLAFSFQKKSFVELTGKKYVVLYGAFILSLVPSCFLALNQGKAWVEFSRLLSYLLFFVMGLFLLQKCDYKKFFLRAIIGFAFISLLIAGIQFAVLRWFSISEEQSFFIQRVFGAFPNSSDLHQQSYFIKSVFAHRNLFAHLLLLSFPFLVYASRREKGFWKIMAVLTLLLTCIPLVFLYVRTVWLMLILSLGWMVLMTILSSPARFFNWKHIAAYLLAATVLVGGMYTYAQHNEKVRITFEKQGYWIDNPTFGSVDERLQMWKATIPMIQEHPIVGVGPGNWGIILPKYAGKEIRDARNGHYTQFQRAHNDYLQAIAEYGIIPILLYFALVLLVFMRLVKAIFYTHDAEQKLWLISLSTFLIAYAGISFFSFPKERVEHSFLLVLVLVISIVETDRQSTKKLNLSFKGFYFLTLILLGSVTLVSASVMRSDYLMKKAFDERMTGSEKQYHWYEKINQPLYTIDPNGTPLAWYQAYQYSSKGNFAMAERYLLEARAANPYHKHTLNDLGSIRYQLGNRTSAQKLYRDALRLASGFNDANVNLSITFVHQEHYDSAWYYLAQCDTPYTENTYQQVWDIVANQIILEMKSEYSKTDSLLASTIQRIEADQDWLWVCHEHAIENNRTFRQQIIEEAIYVLLEMEKVITANQADDMRRENNKQIITK